MKCFRINWVLACLALSGLAVALAAAQAPNVGTSETPEPIARVHSTGAVQPGAEADGRVFREIWKLPSTAQVRAEALDKVAAALAAQFEPKAQSQAGNLAGLIRPLLDDLAGAEFVFEIVEHRQNLLESILALRLDDARLRLWEKNGQELVSNWTLRSQPKTSRASFLATNSWVALHWVSGPEAGAKAQLPENAILSKIQRGQRPVPAAKDYWLKMETDLARWGQWWGGQKEQLPRIHLTVAGRKENLRSEARLTFRQPMISRVEKWQIPVNTIRDPLISFTAIQGIGGWLARQPLFQDMGLEKTSNQLYLWALSQTVFQLQAALPVDDAAAAFNRIASRWVPKVNRTLSEHAVGEIRLLPDRPELVWRGLPVLVPNLKPIREGPTGYLYAGIFPVSPPTNPPPAQLFKVLTSRTNLVFYDWEITQERLAQLRPLAQLASVFLTVSPMSTNSTVFRWLDVIETRLGNTITEVAAASPTEFDLVRTSHVGLNGLELVALANWLDGTNFPKVSWNFNFRPAPTSGKPNTPR